MRVVLKKNNTFDKVDYLKHEEFLLLSVKWNDLHGGDMYYVESKNGKRYTVESNLFDFDCRDVRLKI